MFAAHASWEDIRVGQTFGLTIHIGPKLADALPTQLRAQRRHAIAAVAAHAAVEHKPDWLGCVVDLGKTYRNADDAESAVAVFREYLADAAHKVDYTRVIRGYWHAWSHCEGLRGDDQVHALASAWLGERTGPDEKTLGYFKNHHQAADAVGTPSPSSLKQAIDWLQDGG